MTHGIEARMDNSRLASIYSALNRFLIGNRAKM
jgi:hypothetical protein